MSSSIGLGEESLTDKIKGIVVDLAAGWIIGVISGIGDIVLAGFSELRTAIEDGARALWVSFAPVGDIILETIGIVNGAVDTVAQAAGPLSFVVYGIYAVLIIAGTIRIGRAIIITAADAIPGAQGITTLLGVDS